MTKAIFLDRDGTINQEVDNLRDVRELRLLPFSAKAIKSMRQLGFLVIVVTNQPVVARGWISETELKEVHAVLTRRLAKEGAILNEIYYCPHHPKANLVKYKINCRCRKPGIGLIMKAAKKYDIDLSKSFFIGDRTADIAAGKRAGITTILVKTGCAGRDGKYNDIPDFQAKNLQDVVRIIKKHGR